MLNKISKLGGATIVGLGLVAGVSAPATASLPHTADVELTATVLAMGGLGYETIDERLMKRVLNGYFANEDALVGLPWPGQMAPWNGTLTLDQSVAVGLENMDAAIRNTPGQKIVVAASGTTLVVNEMMRRLEDDPTAPSRDELSFVVLGDADRGVFKQMRGNIVPIVEYRVSPIPVTKYNVMVVAGEYDGLGDWPDRPWNLLAVLNAMTGSGLLQQIIPEDLVDEWALDSWGSVHYDTMFADLSQVPQENITTKVNKAGGVTTTYLVPTADLPMLRPLKTLGVSQNVIDTLETVLRPIIDSAYARNAPPRNPTAWSPFAAATPTTVTEPAATKVAATTGRQPATPITVAEPTSAKSASQTAGRDNGSAPKRSAKAGKRQTSGSR